MTLLFNLHSEMLMFAGTGLIFEAILISSFVMGGLFWTPLKICVNTFTKEAPCVHCDPCVCMSPLYLSGFRDSYQPMSYNTIIRWTKIF